LQPNFAQFIADVISLIFKPLSIILNLQLGVIEKLCGCL